MLPNQLALAPMAGVTDRVFRRLCRRLGAGLTVCEMTASRSDLRNSQKSRFRLDHHGEPAPIVVQLLGNDPRTMAEAARDNVAAGAHVIDINMGCPAKKVCKKAAGSALLGEPALVARILRAVVAAVDVPVTLKIRTGTDPRHKNGLLVSRIAEDCGVVAIAVHGRTRACAYAGAAEYDTIASIKQNVTIPVIANGDISSPATAQKVLDHTGVDGLMIGRAAQGNPWVFREIAAYLAQGKPAPTPNALEVRDTVLEHLRELHTFYGAHLGVRIARKHLGWYLQRIDPLGGLRPRIMRVETAAAQIAAVEGFFWAESTLARAA